MKACLVTVVSLCLAGSGFAAPTQADETNALLAGLISGLSNGQAEGSNIYRRQPEQNASESATNNAQSDKGDDAKGSSGDGDDGGDGGDSGGGSCNGGGKNSPLGGVTDALGSALGGKGGKGGAAGGLTDSLGDLTGGLVGGGQKKKGGLLGGILIPGLLKRELAAEQQGNARTPQKRAGADLALGSFGSKKPNPELGTLFNSWKAKRDSFEGLLGGFLIPGILKRETTAKQEMTAEQFRSIVLEGLLAARPGGRLAHEKRNSAQDQAMTVEQLRSLVLERLVAAQQAAATPHSKRDSRLQPSEVEGAGGNVGRQLGTAIGGLVGSVLSALGLDGQGFLNLSELLGNLPEGYDANRLVAGAAGGSDQSLKELAAADVNGKFVQGQAGGNAVATASAGAAGAVPSPSKPRGAVGTSNSTTGPLSLAKLQN